MKPNSGPLSWQHKQECDEALLAARDVGAVTLQRDKLNPKDGLFERIDLVDVSALARFLGRSTFTEQLAQTHNPKLIELSQAPHFILSPL